MSLFERSDAGLYLPEENTPRIQVSAQPLRPYQQQAVDGIHEQLRENRSTLLVIPTGTGKCLGRGTPVLMGYGGTTQVEGILEGDHLVGPDGGSRTVLSTTKGVGELYRITPVKGEPWVCNDVHVLTLVHTESGEIVDIPLNEYLGKTKYWKHCHKMFRSAASFTDYHGAERTVGPYFLGVFLGDGSINGTHVSVCKPDIEIRSACEREAIRWNLTVHTMSPNTTSPVHSMKMQRRECGRGHRNPLGSALIALGLGGQSIDKHVPRSYLYAPEAIRLEVLAGLIDTDGSLSLKGFDFISISKRLSDDVAFLARSLGLAAYVKSCQKSCQTGAVGTYHRVSISGDTNRIPTRIPRKQASPRSQKKSVLRTGFTVEAIGRGEYFGFELDGDGRFLLGDFTVTHNTRVFTDVAHNWPGRVLVLAHRDELLQQARERIAKETGEMVGLEQAEARAGLERIVVGSVQTLCQPDRLAGWKRDAFGLVICDEAHHGPSPSYKRIFNHFESAKLLGVTATPDRADEKAMGQVFESVAFVYEIEDAINDGYLVPIRVREIFLGELDLAACRTTAGDLNQGDLDAAMVESAIAHMVKSTIEESGDLKTLFFTTSVENATRSAELFNQLKAGSARSVNGKTPIDVRRQTLAGFERGDFQYLTNCGIATEGYDCPPVACIAQGRPTKSRSLHAQIVGRGLRPYPGKSDLLLLEFTGNSGKHNLASAVDILGGKYDEDEIALAKRKVRENQGMRAGDALVEAKAEIEEKKRNEAARKLLLAARANYTKREFNPFDVMHMKRDKHDEWGDRFGGAVPSDAQLGWLQSRRVDIPAGFTKAKASKLIGTLKQREALGLANYNQTKTLEMYGIQSINLSYKKACDLMWIIKSNGNKAPDPKAVDAILKEGSNG